jgi:SAM-dependent methyltransferase
MKPVPGVEGFRRLHPPLWEYNFYLMSLLRKGFEDLIKSYVEPGSGAGVVDYGCGSRPYEPLFAGRASRYIGVDIGPNPRADVVAAPDRPLPLPDAGFDVVLSSQVLEHVGDVDGYLAECARLLKPGGMLFLSTHGFWTYHPYPTDLRRWTCQGLKVDVEKHGFTVEKMRGCLGPLAYTTQLRLQLLRGALYQAGRVALPLIALCNALAQLRMMLEDLVTPGSIGQQNSAIYVLAARRLTAA